VRAAHPFFVAVKGQMRRQGQYQENRPALDWEAAPDVARAAYATAGALDAPRGRLAFGAA
jgi:hypothetical protein